MYLPSPLTRAIFPKIPHRRRLQFWFLAIRRRRRPIPPPPPPPSLTISVHSIPLSDPPRSGFTALLSETRLRNPNRTRAKRRRTASPVERDRCVVDLNMIVCGLPSVGILRVGKTGKTKLESLPFKVGDLAESKSFEVGYRGAWFRCQIKNIKHGANPRHIMEYYDFPDERLRSLKVYQKPPMKSDNVEEEKELMVRPNYPRTYSERDCPDLEKITWASVVTDYAWKVGDLVDWWKDDCFWSGRVAEIIHENVVKIELPEPPMGEGLSYEARCKDLRPSLDWSVEHGWTFQQSLGNEKGPICARLIKPGVEGSKTGPPSTSELSKRKDLPRRSTPTSEDGLQNAAGKTTDAERSPSGNGKDQCLDGVSSRRVEVGSAEAAEATSEEEQRHDSGPSKKMHDERMPLNSMGSDTIESLILDLEELVSRVKWVKRILESGIQDPVQPAWEFLEVHGVPSK